VAAPSTVFFCFAFLPIAYDSGIWKSATLADYLTNWATEIMLPQMCESLMSRCCQLGHFVLGLLPLPVFQVFHAARVFAQKFLSHFFEALLLLL